MLLFAVRPMAFGCTKVWLDFSDVENNASA